MKFVSRILVVLFLFGFFQIITGNSALAKFSSIEEELVEEYLMDKHLFDDFECSSKINRANFKISSFSVNKHFTCLQHLYVKNSYSIPHLELPKLPPENKH